MKPPPQKAREAPVVRKELGKAGPPSPGQGRGVALLSPAEVAHAYLQLKRRLDSAVARLTPPPHPFCREEIVFTHGLSTQHFYGGVSQEHWTLRFECKGKFTLVYQRQEGQVVSTIEMIEGFYKLACAPELGPTAYVALPAQQGTLRSTVELHSVLRVRENQSPVHWAYETGETAEPWEQVFTLDLYPPSDPEYGEMTGFPQADLRQDEGTQRLVLQRARASAAEKACHTEVLLRRRTLAGDPALGSRIPRSAIKHLGRSLMPVDVDTRSPLRAFPTMHTSFPPSALRKSVSTGCLVSPGWGYDKMSMCDRGRVPFLTNLTNRVA